MKDILNYLKTLNIRSLCHKGTNKYYYSANDICMVLTGGTYKQGKNHWQYLKRTRQIFSLENGYTHIKLKLPCSNGKYHLSDILTRKQVLYIISHSKHKNATLLQEIIKQTKSNLCKFREFTIAIGKNKRDEITSIIKETKKIITLTRTVVSKTFSLNQTTQRSA